MIWNGIRRKFCSILKGLKEQDLWLKPDFIESNLKILRESTKSIKNIGVIVGFVDKDKKGIYNAAAFIANKKIIGVQYKTYLPNYGVFDEKRYFIPAANTRTFRYNGVTFGITICEDIWASGSLIKKQVAKRAQLVINISASPFHAGKSQERRQLIAKRAQQYRVPIVYVNAVGCQDSLVFDGQSYAFNKKGELIASARQFEEDFIIVTLEENPLTLVDDPIKETYQALVLGLKDYVVKNGFTKVVLGLSGGIDSSVTAAIAVDALGKDHVIGVMMPSAITSQQTMVDSLELIRNLGIQHKIIPIKTVFDSYITSLMPSFAGRQQDITEENIQARIRGNILMALSNKFGYLVLATGNKSEFSTGYCTLYGDMAGGLAVIGDVAKTTVYKLAEYINREKKIIPNSILIKEPTAELRPRQKDSDSLPSYDILDNVLNLYIEEDKSELDIIKQGFGQRIVADVLKKVDRSEYKRRQAPPCIKITTKAFGKDRRMPITNKYRN